MSSLDPRKSDAVVLCECFARDGLQHEPEFVPTALKLALLEQFTALGFPRIEATSFTHPGNVPQFTDADDILRTLKRKPGTRYKATCVNQRSVERALAASNAGYGPEEISVILAASNAMLQKAFKRTEAEQYKVIGGMIEAAQGRFELIGTVSFALGCPYEGPIEPARIIQHARWLADHGVRYIAIGDTTGMGNPRLIKRLFGELLDALPDIFPIAHFHDTRGLGITNCLAAYEAGVRHFDCAFGGTGGNPAKISYVEGYSGNVCTEDLVTMFESMGIPTGLNIDHLLETARQCEEALGRELEGRVTRSGLGLLCQPLGAEHV